MTWTILGVFGFVGLAVWFAYRAGKKTEQVKTGEKLIAQKEAHERALTRWIEDNDKISEENKILRKQLYLARGVDDIVSVLEKTRDGAKVIKTSASR